MYQPSDDSILLYDCIKEYHGKLALEIGVGSGVITEALCKNFEYVAGTDIVIDILTRLKEIHPICQDINDGVLKHGTRYDLICSDAASAFRMSSFDLIVCNPPYLPNDYDIQCKRICDETIYGGPTGIEQTLHIVRSSIPSMKKEGSMVIIVSSLSDVLRVHQLTQELDLKIKKIAERKFFFESLSALEIRY